MNEELVKLQLQLGEHMASENQAIRTFNDYIKGKKVIFVGPSPNMVGRRLGKWIDNEFDIVVRSNGSINLIDKIAFIEDYGRKCDILYTNVQFAREMKPMPVELWRKKGITYLCMKNINSVWYDRYSKFIRVINLGDIVKEYNAKIHGLLFGVVIMEHLKRQKPKELWFTGMDFYKNKDFVFEPDNYNKEYYPGYLPDIVVKKANKANIGKIDNHDIVSNTSYFYNNYRKGDFKTNDFVVNIMEEILENPEQYSIEAKFKANSGVKN